MERRLGSPDDYQHLFTNNDTGIIQPPEINATISLSATEYSEILPEDPLGMSDTHPVKVHVAKQIVADDSGISWKTFAVSIGNHDVIANGSVTQEIDGVDTGDLIRRLADLLQRSFRVVYTTESPRSWPDRFTERPTIIEPSHVAELWQRSQSKGRSRRPWAQVTQKYEKIAPNNQRPAGVASSIQVQEGALAVSIGMTGEGSQAILRLLDQLECGAQVMAIEEPESHLHPALIKKVGQLLSASADSGRQLFVSTHSPFLIDRSSLHNFFVVKSDNGTDISPMNSEKLRELLLDIGMKPSDVLFCDAILLVEGYSDELCFYSLSNTIRTPLAGQHVKVVRSNGKSRAKYKIGFWSEVGRDAGIPLYLILDKGAEPEAKDAVERGQIPEERCLILSKGELEDYYPWPAIKEALNSSFGIEIEEPIPSGSRVSELRKRLGGKWKGNTWKPRLAESVAGIITREDVESEMGEVASFLRKICSDLAVD